LYTDDTNFPYADDAARAEDRLRLHHNPAPLSHQGSGRLSPLDCVSGGDAQFRCFRNKSGWLDELRHRATLDRGDERGRLSREQPVELAGDGTSRSQLQPAAKTASFGFGCTGSQMGSFYSDQLGGVKGSTIQLTPNANYALFNNFQPYLYWSSTLWTNVPNSAFSFSFGNGFQGTNVFANETYAIAVPPGKSVALTGHSPVLRA
jgi:hypothetical protein